MTKSADKSAIARIRQAFSARTISQAENATGKATLACECVSRSGSFQNKFPNRFRLHPNFAADDLKLCQVTRWLDLH